MMPGPAPKKNARRTNARPDWRVLPRAGRAGPPPKWPIGRADKDTLAIWRSLWASPQAEAWEDLGWTRVVARYAQVLRVCEGPAASAAMLAEARQIEDRLGLSPMAMKRLQWELSPAEPVSVVSAEVANIDDYRDF